MDKKESNLGHMGRLATTPTARAKLKNIGVAWAIHKQKRPTDKG